MGFGTAKEPSRSLPKALNDKPGLFHQGLAPNIVFGLFLMKALLLAVVLIPFGVGPDERHHFSYAYDLANGDLSPILGGAQSVSIPSSARWPSEVQTFRDNYISQHPPLHYVVAALPVRAAISVTNSTEVILRSARLVSAIFGALGLLVVHRLLLLVARRDDIALAGMVGLSFLPMYSYLSSVVNNDVSLFFFSALAAESFVRFIARRESAEAAWFFVWVGLAAFTKAFAWISGAMAVAVVLVLLMKETRRWKALVAYTIAAAAAPALWILRNSVVRGDALAGSGLGSSAPRFRVTPWSYVTEYPVVDWLLLHSNALYGWVRPGLGPRILTVTGWPLVGFSLFLLVLGVVMVRATAIAMVAPVEAEAEEGVSPLSTAYRAFVLSAAAIGAISIFRALPPGLEVSGSMRAFFVGALVFASISSAAELLRRRHEPLDGANVALLLFSAYAVIFFVQRSMGFAGGDAPLRGVHGRYFWTALPFLLVFMGAAARRIGISRLTLAASVALLALMEIGAYLTQLFPHEGVL